MKSAADYFTATMPEPWQILGLRLRPFSLEHYKLLRRFGCAFVAEEETSATKEDLILGILACSMLPSEFVTFIETLDYEKRVKEWGKKIGIFNINEKAQLFKDYIEAHSVVPKYWQEKPGGTSGAHWSQCVEVVLRSKLGWTKRDLERNSLSKAFADYFKYEENEGAVRLMTRQEIDLIESSQEVVCGT